MKAGSTVEEIQEEMRKAILREIQKGLKELQEGIKRIEEERAKRDEAKI